MLCWIISASIQDREIDEAICLYTYSLVLPVSSARTIEYLPSRYFLFFSLTLFCAILSDSVNLLMQPVASCGWLWMKLLELNIIRRALIMLGCRRDFFSSSHLQLACFYSLLPDQILLCDEIPKNRRHFCNFFIVFGIRVAINKDVDHSYKHSFVDVIPEPE